MMQTAAMMFSEKDPKHHVDIKQLLIILSDGRGVFSEGETVHICSSFCCTIVNVGLTHISAHRHSHYIEKSLYMYTCITSYLLCTTCAWLQFILPIVSTVQMSGAG